jgi:hypothetical protein
MLTIETPPLDDTLMKQSSGAHVIPEPTWPTPARRRAGITDRQISAHFAHGESPFRGRPQPSLTAYLRYF